MIDPQTEAEIEAILVPLRQQQPGITNAEVAPHLPERLRGPFWERAVDRYMTEELAKLDANGDQQ